MSSLIRPLALVFLLTAGASVGVAQDAASLAGAADAAYTRGDYAEGAELYAAAVEAGADDVGTPYNAACSFALAGGHTDEAFRYLTLAVDRGWADVDHLQADTDLASLHNDPRWDPLVAQVEDRARQDRLRWAGEAFQTPYRDTLTTEEKVAGLSRLWAEAKFNFINFDLVPDLDWDSLYVATLPRAAAAPTTEAYYRVLTETVARLQDGHSNVFPPNAIADRFYSRPAFRTRLVGDAVAVTAVYDDALRAEGIEPGVELVAIDGEPVRAYAEAAVRPYQSASTPQDLDVRTYEYMLLAGAPGPVRLTFRDGDGEPFDRVVQRLAEDEVVASGMRARMQRPAFQFEMRPGNMAYVQLNSFSSPEAAEQFVAAFDEIARADALVLDVRNNGGGNGAVGWAILATLTDGPVPISSWRTLDYRPAYRAWGRGTQTYGETGLSYPADGTRHFTGPVAVLISPRTFSAAEDFAVAFDAMERGLLVGEPTGGSTGQPLSFTLPGGGSARVTTKRDTYPDGRDFVGTGVLPDVAVTSTLADLRTGQDPVLEAALDAVRSQAE